MLAAFRSSKSLADRHACRQIHTQGTVEACDAQSSALRAVCDEQTSRRRGARRSRARLTAALVTARDMLTQHAKPAQELWRIDMGAGARTLAQQASTKAKCQHLRYSTLAAAPRAQQKHTKTRKSYQRCTVPARWGVAQRAVQRSAQWPSCGMEQSQRTHLMMNRRARGLESSWREDDGSAAAPAAFTAAGARLRLLSKQLR